MLAVTPEVLKIKYLKCVPANCQQAAPSLAGAHGATSPSRVSLACCFGATFWPTDRHAAGESETQVRVRMCLGEIFEQCNKVYRDVRTHPHPPHPHSCCLYFSQGSELRGIGQKVAPWGMTQRKDRQLSAKCWQQCWRAFRCSKICTSGHRQHGQMADGPGLHTFRRSLY